MVNISLRFILLVFSVQQRSLPTRTLRLLRGYYEGRAKKVP
jgi:hypothetical protein